MSEITRLGLSLTPQVQIEMFAGLMRLKHGDVKQEVMGWGVQLLLSQVKNHPKSWGTTILFFIIGGAGTFYRKNDSTQKKMQSLLDIISYVVQRIIWGRINPLKQLNEDKVQLLQMMSGISAEITKIKKEMKELSENLLVVHTQQIEEINTTYQERMSELGNQLKAHQKIMLESEKRLEEIATSMEQSAEKKGFIQSQLNERDNKALDYYRRINRLENDKDGKDKGGK